MSKRVCQKRWKFCQNLIKWGTQFSFLSFPLKQGYKATKAQRVSEDERQ